MARGPVSADTDRGDGGRGNKSAGSGSARWKIPAAPNGSGAFPRDTGIMYVRRRYPAHSPRPHGFGWWCLEDLAGVAVFSSEEDAKLATRECVEQRGNGVRAVAGNGFRRRAVGRDGNALVAEKSAGRRHDLGGGGVMARARRIAGLA